eukprot:TRINITY_DN13142_c0_g1_i1.p1 TRINITY_DN13142_c0_g1~~TRINITY_DN13142_c0_g1_i1.p1  ORF type:complete len:230 (-),score=60.18 TRINITY_DN13142_c0_g1_i1:146-835(-)
MSECLVPTCRRRPMSIVFCVFTALFAASLGLSVVFLYQENANAWRHGTCEIVAGTCQVNHTTCAHEKCDGRKCETTTEPCWSATAVFQLRLDGKVYTNRFDERYDNFWRAEAQCTNTDCYYDVRDIWQTLTHSHVPSSPTMTGPIVAVIIFTVGTVFFLCSCLFFACPLSLRPWRTMFDDCPGAGEAPHQRGAEPNAEPAGSACEMTEQCKCTAVRIESMATVSIDVDE